MNDTPVPTTETKESGATILVGLDAENQELTFEAVSPPDPTATPQPEMAGQD